MKNVILATDFSDNARNSIVYAIEMFGDVGVQYTLLNTFWEPQMNKDILITIRDILEKRSKEGLKNEIEYIKEKFPNKTLNIEETSAHGRLPEVINTLARKKRFEFAIVGTKGKTGSWYIGSTSKQMVQKSSVPIVVIPENARYKPISKIVYATDLVEDESFLINQLISFAELRDAHITILHVARDTSNSEWSIEELKGIVEKSTYKRVMFEELISKKTEDAIIKYSEENDIDLLAMTTYTTLLLKKLFHRSLTKQMILNSDVPMLIYNRKNYDYVFLG